MKIKQKYTKDTKSFVFPLDLTKVDVLGDILLSCKLSSVYLDLYSVLDKNSCIQRAMENNLFEELHIDGEDKDIHNFSIKIHSERITSFLSDIQNSNCIFEDFNIWSCDTSTEQHLKDIWEPEPFLPFKKKQSQDLYTFYLNYKEGEALIVCDLDKYPNLSKKFLCSLLN